jgi:two-component system CitB family sensor kinase
MTSSRRARDIREHDRRRATWSNQGRDATLTGMPRLVPHRIMRARASRLSIAVQVLLLQLGTVALLTVGGTATAIEAAHSTQTAHARSETLALAETVADSPGIAADVTGPDPTARLEPTALAVEHATGVDFVVVMSPAGIRYTHPTPSEIGKHYLGDTAPALAGHPFTETYTGTLGPSVRSVAPVYGPDHRIVGLVSVGITLEQLSATAQRELPLILAIATGAVAIVGLGTWALSRRLRKQTLGLGPQEITRLYEHHDAVLHAMHEGLIVLDRERTVLLANDEAQRLLGLDADPTGRAVADLALDPALQRLLDSGFEAHDETYTAADRILAVNQSPARSGGRSLGTVVTLRDHTELRALAGELDSARSFANALSATAHESANRLHTVVTLIELDRPADAVRFATAELAASQHLVDRLMSAVGDPAVAALLLGTVSHAAERQRRHRRTLPAVRDPRPGHHHRQSDRQRGRGRAGLPGTAPGLGGPARRGRRTAGPGRRQRLGHRFHARRGPVHPRLDHQERSRTRHRPRARTPGRHPQPRHRRSGPRPGPRRRRPDGAPAHPRPQPGPRGAATVIGTLIVEDDPVLAQAHRVFTERVPGFTVTAVAHLGSEALRTCPT